MDMNLKDKEHSSKNKLGCISGGYFKMVPNAERESAVILVMQREASAPGGDQ